MGLVSINHTSFTVSNALAIAEWYCEMLDFTIVSVDTRPKDYSEKVTGIAGADLRIVYILGGGYHIELVEYVGAPGVRIDTATNNVGSAHIAYNVNDLKGMYETLWRPKGCGSSLSPRPSRKAPTRGASSYISRIPTATRSNSSRGPAGNQA